MDERFSMSQVYDYVIVGGGSAGCVLASRLSAKASNTVVLCEAGGDVVPGDEPADILDIYAGRAYLNPDYTWKDLRVTTEIIPHNQPHAAAPAPRKYEQARILGGGSSINGQMANRGAPADYDKWQELGVVGWSWRDVLPYFRKLEHDVDFGGPLHGKEGPIQISRIKPDRWPLHAKAVAKAFAEAGYDYVEDQNGEFQDNFFPISISNVDGKRITAATAYLSRDVRSRANLHIRTNTQVSKLLFNNGNCYGVVVRNPSGQFETINAREVILSAGAIHSPAILMRAGIGPAGLLKDLGIPLVARRDGVGRSLTDHPAVAVGSYIRPDARLNGITRRHMLLALRYSSSLPGGQDGDMFIIGVSKSAWHSVGDQIGSLLVNVNQTLSQTGTVDIVSSDWAVEPKVDFNLLSDRRDFDRLVDGFRRMAAMQLSAAMQEVCRDPFPASYNEKVRQVGTMNWWNRSRTWVASRIADAHPKLRQALYERFVKGEFSLDELMVDEDKLQDFVRRYAIGLWHASCSCRMGAATDSMAVTDSSGRVHGVTGLRVVDASIFPVVPRANTNIPTMMVAEKISDMILRGH